MITTHQLARFFATKPDVPVVGIEVGQDENETGDAMLRSAQFICNTTGVIAVVLKFNP